MYYVFQMYTNYIISHTFDQHQIVTDSCQHDRILKSHIKQVDREVMNYFRTVKTSF